jgi:hypothetical protein
MPVHNGNLIVSYSPHACPTPGSVPLLFSIVLRLPHFHSRASTTDQIGSLEALSLQFDTSGNDSQQLSHLERMQSSMGLTTLLFNPLSTSIYVIHIYHVEKIERRSPRSKMELQ